MENMRKITLLVFLLSTCFISGCKAPTPMGAWKLEGYKRGTDPSFKELPENHCRIKLITDTRFTWVEFDTVTQEFYGMLGGTCSLTGNTYTESIEYSDPNRQGLLNRKNSFTIRLEDEKLFLSQGKHYEEVWHRVMDSTNSMIMIEPDN